MATESLVETPHAPEAPTRGIVRAAGIIALGGLMSRVLGFVLEILIPYYFGASGAVSVFRVAETWSQTLYDFLVGGTISAALVPVFSEHANNRDELWRIVSVVASVFVAALALVVIGVEIFATPLVDILSPGYSPELQATATEMIRIVSPAVFFLGLAGILTAVLYALRRFKFPAFTTAAYNACVILAAVALAPYLGIFAVGVGILLGAASQVVLQLPGLRDARLRLQLDWRHPALKQIVKLYLPVLAGAAVALVGVTIDRNLASRTGEQSIAWMQQATVLIQFPIGLGSAAIAIAILPRLANTSDPTAFRQTLTGGLKLVLLLILPAAVILFLLAPQIVGLLFQHGRFTADDTGATANALRLYVFGLPFAAIDQPIVFAFYARKNTLLPNLIAFVGVAAYLVVALALMGPLGYLGLVLANSAQLTVHALVMLFLAQTRLGGLDGEGLGTTLLKLMGASAVMGLVMFLLPQVDLTDGLLAQFVHVIVPLAAGGIGYVVVLKVLRVPELEQAWEIVLNLTRRRRAL